MFHFQVVEHPPDNHVHQVPDLSGRNKIPGRQA